MDACCKMHANKREEITEIYAGDICACVGLKNITTGDTICDDRSPDRSGIDRVPGAGYRGCGGTEDQGRPGKDGHRAGQAGAGRSTFKVRTDPDSGQTIIEGMGELHLEIIVDRMMREFNVRGQRRQAAGRVSRDHPQGVAGGRQVHSPDRRQRSVRTRASIRLEPNEPGKGYEFVNEVVGGVIPKEFIKPVDQGIKEAMEGGVLAGYEWSM